MSHRHLALAALLLALAAAGCGSPLDSHPDNVLTTDVASEGDETPTPKATATGSPSRQPGRPPTTQPTPDPDRPPQTVPAPSPESTSKPEAKAKPKPEVKSRPAPKPESEAETKAESKPAPKPQAKAKPKPEPEEPPAAKGSPLKIVTFEIVGQPYADNSQHVDERIAEACGGTACINVRFEYAGPQSLNCEVESIDQPNPIFAGDTITFALSDVCDEGSEE